MDKPDGNISPGRYRGLFVRNAQPIGNGVFLAEAQATATGQGKVWRQTVIRPNPKAGELISAGYPPNFDPVYEADWQSFGEVKPAMMAHRKGQFKVTLWAYIDEVHRYVEAFFPTELRAVQFMVHNAVEFIKP